MGSNNTTDNRTRSQKLHDLLHSDGELSEVYSNYQAQEIQSQNKVSSSNISQGQSQNAKPPRKPHHLFESKEASLLDINQRIKSK